MLKSNLYNFFFGYKNLKYFVGLFVIAMALVFYFFFVIMSYIWPFLLIAFLGGSIYLYFQGKKKDDDITYYK